jgi:hypothetical protein
MKEKILEIVIGSPPEYEELVAYIQANDRSIYELLYRNSGNSSRKKSRTEVVNGLDIALLHQEEGPEKVKIKFLEGIQEQEYAFDELMSILKKAKEALLS